MASEVTSGRSSKTGATRGGGPLADAERLILDFAVAVLTGDTWPFSCSDLGLTSISSRAGLDLDSEDTEGERLLLRCVELMEGERETLVESRLRTLVT